MVICKITYIITVYGKELSLQPSFYKKVENIEDTCVTKFTLDLKYTKSNEDIMNILVDLRKVNVSLIMRLLIVQVMYMYIIDVIPLFKKIL